MVPMSEALKVIVAGARPVTELRLKLTLRATVSAESSITRSSKNASSATSSEPRMP
jgi:hypothetical protein